MMILFEEIDQSIIVNTYPSYAHHKARYFKITKDNKILCFYGIIAHTDEIGEAFLMMKTCHGKVLTKEFFVGLFHHAFSLGYKEIYTWTKWHKLIRLFERFRKFGIIQTECPPWDADETKVWFLKRI